MKKILVLCALFVIAGCDADKQCSKQVVVPSEGVNYLSKNAIYLPDGAGIEFSGRLRSYELVENDKGAFDRYVFEFSEDTMAVEGSVFATLAKSGYQRKVRNEDEKTYVVSYFKKGFENIYMTYERVPLNRGMEPFTRLKIVWKKA